MVDGQTLRDGAFLYFTAIVDMPCDLTSTLFIGLDLLGTQVQLGGVLIIVTFIVCFSAQGDATSERQLGAVGLERSYPKQQWKQCKAAKEGRVSMGMSLASLQ